jgi:glutathione peroxidase
MRSFKTLLAFVMALLPLAVRAEFPQGTTAYDFSFRTIDEAPLPLSDFRGKVLLVVNTASECGFTGQYKDLQKLWETYRDQGLVVLAVPSNDFGGQEPGSNQEVKEFCETTFRVDFPLAAKETVVGEKAHPFYQWARKQGGALSAPKWNFHKYLIGRDGAYINYYLSPTKPMSRKLRDAVEAALKAPVPVSSAAAPAKGVEAR